MPKRHRRRITQHRNRAAWFFLQCGQRRSRKPLCAVKPVFLVVRSQIGAALTGQGMALRSKRSHSA
jgi:hypothetical protein